jgi:hypothetical protein
MLLLHWQKTPQRQCNGARSGISTSHDEAGVGAYLDWSGGTTSQDTTGFSFFPATGAATVVKVRTKLVDAAYVILGADLLAREVPAVLQELMGLPTQRERKREIISVVTAREF